MKSLKNIKKTGDVNIDQLVTDEGLRRQILMDDLTSSDIKLKHINKKINQRARMVFVRKQQMYEWRYQYLNNTLEPTDWYTKWPEFPEKVRELIVERYLLISSICNKVFITDEDIEELAKLRKWSLSKTQKWLKRYRSFGLLGLEVIERKSNRKISIDPKGITMEEHGEILDALDKLGSLVNVKKPTGAQWHEQAAIAGCHENTVKKIHKACFADELYILVRQERSDSGVAKGLSPEVEKAIRSYRLVHRGATPGEIYDFIIIEAEKKGLSIPSIDQVRFALNTISPAQTTHAADQNWVMFRNLFKITGKMVRPLGVLAYCIDWTKVPVLLIDIRGGKIRSKSRTVTAYLTVMMEFDSRKVLSFQLSYNQPDRYVVAGVYLEGVISHGVPDELIHDSGNAEKSKHMKRISAELKTLPFQLEHQPQKNRIERFFKTLKTQKAPRLTGYTGKNPGDRHPNITPKLTIFDLDLELRDYFDKYNNEEHSSLGKISPAQYFSEYIFAPNVNPNNLSYLALDQEDRHVNKGYIPYRTHEFWNKELGLHHGEVRVRGAKVYGPPEFLFVYKLDNTFICKARNATLWPPAQAEIAEAQAYQDQHMTKVERDAKEFLKEFAGADALSRESASKQQPAPQKQKKNEMKTSQNIFNDLTEIRRRNDDQSA